MPSTGKTDSQQFTVLPSGYDIISVVVTLNNGNTIEIQPLVASIEVVENIFSPSIKVIFRIVDGFGLLTDGHIIGGEKIDFQIGRAAIDTKEAEVFVKSAFIAEIHDHTTPKVGLQSYTFTCLSEHAFINNSKTVNNAFDGNIANLVSSICLNELNESITTDDKASDLLTGIYPNLKPYDAITWLLRNSTDEGTPYFFYETLKDGLQFNSYKQLVDKDIYREYNNSPFYQFEVGSAEHYKEAKTKIIKMSSDLNTSLYKLIGKGAYASSVQTLDIATKKYTVTDNAYKDSFEKLNKNGKYFSDKTKFNENELVNNFKARQFFISKNSKSFSTKNNYHNVISNSISDKTSQYSSLGFMGLDIFLYGDFNLSVGKKVNLKITKSTDEKIQESNRKTGMLDNLLSGNYIVTSLAHVFDGTEYKCDVGIQKDSLIFDLDSEIRIGKKGNEKQGLLR